MTGEPENGWREYQRLVLDQLRRHTDELVLVRAQLGRIEIRLAVVETKAAMWGAGTGAVFGAAVALAVKFLL